MVQILQSTINISSNNWIVSPKTIPPLACTFSKLKSISNNSVFFLHLVDHYLNIFKWNFNGNTVVWIMMYVVTNFKNREFRKTIIKLTWIHQVSLTFEKFSGYSKVWAEKKSTSVYYSSEKKTDQEKFCGIQTVPRLFDMAKQKNGIMIYIHTYL